MSEKPKSTYKVVVSTVADAVPIVEASFCCSSPGDAWEAGLELLDEQNRRLGAVHACTISIRDAEGKAVPPASLDPSWSGWWTGV